VGDLTQAIELDRQNAIAFEKRGQAHVMLRDSRSALADFSQALQLNPRSATAFYYRGGIEGALGQPQAAKIDLQQAANLYRLQNEGDGYRKALDQMAKL
jgi:tetratricopeptide (TPR) repeat protein